MLNIDGRPNYRYGLLESVLNIFSNNEIQQDIKIIKLPSIH